MAAVIHLCFYNYISVIWEQKITIVGGLFLAFSIYSYFYRRKRINDEIEQLKKEAIIFEIIKQNLINAVMSENEKYTIKEMVSKLSEKVETLESDVRSDIKELTSMFSKYMITNNDRISLLEGKQKVTTKTIAIYLGFIGMFIMLAINTYMSFRG